MKPRLILLLPAILMGSVFVLVVPSQVLGQASAVDDIDNVIGASGRVDTTWLSNAAATAVYTLVYSQGGYDSSTGPGWVTNTYGILPAGMSAPSREVTTGTTTYKLFLNNTTNRYYIKKRGEAYTCNGASAWGESYYEGYFINAKPRVDVFSAAPKSVLLGRASTITATVKDDGNMTEVRLKYLPPQSSIWVDGSTAAGTLWTGTGGSNVTLGYTRNYNLLGNWTFRLSAKDTRVENAMGDTPDLLVSVYSITLYDPTGVYGTTYPSLTNTIGAGSVLRAGQTALIPIEFTISGATAGKPVRVSVGKGGGKLFPTSTPSGAGADFLELTTNASGKVTAYYQAGSVPGAIAGVYATAGLSFAKLELAVGLPTGTQASDPQGAIDTDGDGMPDRMELALGGASGVAHTGSNPVAGFSMLNP